MRIHCLVSCLLAIGVVGCKPLSKKDQSDSEGTDGTADDGKDVVDPAKTGILAISGNLAGVDADTMVVFGVGGTNTADGPGKTAITGGVLALEIPTATKLWLDGGSGTGSGSGSGEGRGSGSGAETSTIIMVMKDAENRLDAFDSMQFVSAPTAGDENLMNLETSAVKVDAIDLGTISAQGEDLVSDQKIGTDQFDIAESQLTEMAKLDDALRIKKNSYVNKSKDGNVGGALEFYWDGDLSGAVAGESDPKKLNFLGWSPQLQISHPDFLFADLCDSAKATFKHFRLELPAPGAKRETNGEYVTAIVNDGVKINTDGHSCGGGTDQHFYCGGGTGSEIDNLFMNFGSGTGFSTEIPKGTWVLKLGDEVKAKYDFALSFPLVPDPANPNARVPRVYVPSVRLVTNPTTHVVTGVEVWFYTYDRVTQTYVKVQDYTIMKKLVESVMFNLNQSGVPDGANDGTDMNSTYSWPEAGKPKVLDGAMLKHAWAVNAGDYANCPQPNGAMRASEVDIQYNMQGNRYMFNIKLPSIADQGNCP